MDKELEQTQEEILQEQLDEVANSFREIQAATCRLLVELRRQDK